MNESEKFFRREAIFSRKEMSIEDASGQERYRQSIEFFAEDDHITKRMSGFTLAANEYEVDLFALMDIDPHEVSVVIVGTNKPALYRPSLKRAEVYNPTSPLRLLIMIHELAHAQQITETNTNTLHMPVPTYDVALSWTMLRALPFQVDLPEETYQRVMQIHTQLCEIVRQRNSDSQNDYKSKEFKQLTSHFTELMRANPIVAKLVSLTEILEEQDAHARTNVLFERIQQELHADMDFYNDTDNSLSARLAQDKSVYTRMYEVLATRKESNLCSREIPIAEYCRRIGIPIKDTLPDDLRGYFEGEEFQSDLSAVRIKMRGFG